VVSAAVVLAAAEAAPAFTAAAVAPAR